MVLLLGGGYARHSLDYYSVFVVGWISPPAYYFSLLLAFLAAIVVLAAGRWGTLARTKADLVFQRNGLD